MVITVFSKFGTFPILNSYDFINNKTDNFKTACTAQNFKKQNVFPSFNSKTLCTIKAKKWEFPV